MDDLTPMEPAEILECDTPDKKQPEQTGYYGTCAVQKKRRHTGLILFLCLLLLLFGGTIVFLSYYEIQAERTDGGYSVRVVQRGWTSEEPASDDDPQDPAVSDSAGADTGLDSTLQQENSPDGEMSLQEIYAAVRPSVVSITSDAGQGGKDSGTGVILDADGYIITCYHVVSNGGRISVLLYDDTCYTGVVAAADEISDLAVLKIDAQGLVPASFGDSDSLQVGDEVVAIGDPLGTELRGTMTNGIVSAINRNLEIDGVEMTLIQTNAALNTGNSGGPLINLRGQVVGINTAKISSEYSLASVEGLGFAIPIQTVKEIVDDLMNTGYVSGRASLRLSVADMDELQRIYLGLPQGVYIVEIEEASNAYAAGIRYGDIIVEINGSAITCVKDYNAVLAGLSPGDTVQVIIYRSGKLHAAEVTLEEQTG